MHSNFLSLLALLQKKLEKDQIINILAAKRLYRPTKYYQLCGAAQSPGLHLAVNTGHEIVTVLKAPSCDQDQHQRPPLFRLRRS
jgi:hypothetical protein